MKQDIVQKKCFTIGYGDYPIELFLYFLQRTGIDTIIDVRSSPYSKYNFIFNRENLEKTLIKNQICYLFMGDKIGGRYTNPNLLYPDGTVNYQKVQNTEKFQEGISDVLSIISSGKKIALMCAEKEPERCHRFALISRVLQAKGIKVLHIRPDIKLQSNEDLEKELIKTTIDNRQINITDEPVNFVDSMYEKLNKNIAYKIKDYHQSVDENGVADYPVHVPSFNPPEKNDEEIKDLPFTNERVNPPLSEIDILPKPNSLPDKPNDIQDIPLVNEVSHSSLTIDILSPSDSSVDKRLKKPVQKTLF